MLFDQATPEQMRAARALTLVTMAGLLSARLFGRFAARVRIGIAGTYILAVVGFTVYSLY